MYGVAIRVSNTVEPDQSFRYSAYDLSPSLMHLQLLILDFQIVNMVKKNVFAPVTPLYFQFRKKSSRFLHFLFDTFVGSTWSHAGNVWSVTKSKELYITHCRCNMRNVGVLWRFRTISFLYKPNRN